MKRPKIEKPQDTYFLAVRRKKKIIAVKIGVTTRGKVGTRLQNLQTGSVDKLELLCVFEGNIERKLQRRFKRVRGEFFKPTPALLKLIKQLNEAAALLKLLEEHNL